MHSLHHLRSAARLAAVRTTSSTSTSSTSNIIRRIRTVNVQRRNPSCARRCFASNAAVAAVKSKKGVVPLNPAADVRRGRIPPPPPPGRPPISLPGLPIIASGVVFVGLICYRLFFYSPSKPEEAAVAAVVDADFEAESEDVKAASPFSGDKAPQSAVAAADTQHAAFVTLTFADSATAQQRLAAIAAVAQAEQLVSGVVEDSGMDVAKDSDALAWSAGFSGQTWSLATGATLDAALTLQPRSCASGALPATGGDMFMHVKSNSESLCFEFVRRLRAAMPPAVAAQVQIRDVYGFAGSDGRELLGFRYGGANEPDQLRREEVALDADSGSSFALVQQWVNKADAIKALKDEDLERVIGRTKATGEQLGPVAAAGDGGRRLEAAIAAGLPADSHVARMTVPTRTSVGIGGRAKIVRHSLPYGTASGTAGLMFTAYARDACIFQHLLDRMVGKAPGVLNLAPPAAANAKGGESEEATEGTAAATTTTDAPDALLRVSECVAGQLYFVPSKKQLADLAATAAVSS